MEDNQNQHQRDQPEPLLTYREAAEQLGIPYYKIQRSAKLGIIPTYSLLNQKRYVRASDIIRLMQHSGDG